MTKATRIINGKRVPAYVGAPARRKQSPTDRAEASPRTRTRFLRVLLRGGAK